MVRTVNLRWVLLAALVVIGAVASIVITTLGTR